MTHMHARLASAAILCLAFAWALPAQGRNVAEPAWRGHLALVSRGHLGLALQGYGAILVSHVVQGDSKPNPAPSGTGEDPATEEQGPDALATAEAIQGAPPLGDSPLQPVTVEHQGRLLVLTYGPKPGAGALASPTSTRGESPRFAIYQGQRQIAAGQFEYG